MVQPLWKTIWLYLLKLSISIPYEPAATKRPVQERSVSPPGIAPRGPKGPATTERLKKLAGPPSLILTARRRNSLQPQATTRTELRKRMSSKRSHVKRSKSTQMEFRNRWNYSVLLVERVQNDGHPWR